MPAVPTLLAPIHGALAGPRHLLLGFRLLLRPGVRGFMLIPLAGNILLYGIAAALAFGSWLQDRPVRLTAAHVRRLLGSGSNADSAERKIDGAAQESPVRARRTSHEHALP